jgi:two-component system sensor histidine kinase KdpD
MNPTAWTNMARKPGFRVASLDAMKRYFKRIRVATAFLLHSAPLVGGSPSETRPSGAAHEYLRALALTGCCSALAFPLARYLGPVNIVMLYLLCTAVGALKLQRRPSCALAGFNTLAFDFFFVPPVFSFEVQDLLYLFTLGVMLIVALVIADLVARIRIDAERATARERRTAVLYAMSRELAVAPDARAMSAAAVRQICAVFQGTAVVLLADQQGRLSPSTVAAEAARECHRMFLQEFDLAVASDVAQRCEKRIQHAIYLPLLGARHANGVLVVNPLHSPDALGAEQLNLLDAFAGQLALSLERVRLAESAEAARISAERALLRNTLLASISHDLRTPLSAIAGAGSLLAQPEYALSDDRRATLGHLIERKAQDMSQLLTNVLELVQLEFGSGVLRTEWHAVDELVELALRANALPLAQRRIELNMPDDLPFIMVEATLVIQILTNLLQNAAKYTPPGTTVTIAAAARDKDLLLVVEDDGPGLPPGDPELLFEKFQRGHAESNVTGVGLGLAICRAAARLHGGDIHAMANSSGGARFEISLPVETLSEMPDLSGSR